jgi:hypothetical protein
MLNVIEQAKLTRIINRLYERLQKLEGYFSGVPISTARIGEAIISNAKIADLSVTTGKLANLTVENAKINDLSAVKITTGTLDADRIGADTITASKLDVDSLSSIVSDIGSINAGTIDGVTVTGGTIKTVESGSRVQITGSPEELNIYDGTNKRTQIGNGSIYFYGNGAIKLYDNDTLYAQFDASSSSMNLIATSSSTLLAIRENNDGDMTILADDIVNLIAPTVRIKGTAKTAIVPTKSGYKALYCVESPEIWFIDFYKDKIDPIFNEVTSGKKYEFKCIGGNKLLLSRRNGFENLRFEKKTSIEFDRNNNLYA